MTTIHVHVYLKAAHLVILLTFFANQSDPYLICYDLKQNIRYVLHAELLLTGWENHTHTQRRALSHTHTFIAGVFSYTTD